MGTSTRRSTAVSAVSDSDLPAVYYGLAGPGFGGIRREWRCRRCRRTVDDHYLTGSDGCVPREVLRDLVWGLEEAAEQTGDDDQQPQPVRQALAVLREHGWQLEHERRHPDLDHPQRETRVLARQPWQDHAVRQS